MSGRWNDNKRQRYDDQYDEQQQQYDNRSGGGQRYDNQGGVGAGGRGGGGGYHRSYSAGSGGSGGGGGGGYYNDRQQQQQQQQPPQQQQQQYDDNYGGQYDNQGRFNNNNNNNQGGFDNQQGGYQRSGSRGYYPEQQQQPPQQQQQNYDDDNYGSGGDRRQGQGGRYQQQQRGGGDDNYGGGDRQRQVGGFGGGGGGGSYDNRGPAGQHDYDGGSGRRQSGQSGGYSDSRGGGDWRQQSQQQGYDRQQDGGDGYYGGGRQQDGSGYDRGTGFNQGRGDQRQQGQRYDDNQEDWAQQSQQQQGYDRQQEGGDGYYGGSRQQDGSGYDRGTGFNQGTGDQRQQGQRYDDNQGDWRQQSQQQGYDRQQEGGGGYYGGDRQQDGSGYDRGAGFDQGRGDQRQQGQRYDNQGGYQRQGSFGDNQGGGRGGSGGYNQGGYQRQGSFGDNRGGGGRGFGRGYDNRGRGFDRGGGRGGYGRGGSGGGRDQGRGGGRFGRGGGGRGRFTKVPAEAVNSVITNLIPAKVSDTFSFHVYTVDCSDAKGQSIESRSIRRFLFRSGMDKIHQDIPEKQRRDLERTIFFVGSGFYSARPLAGLEGKELPFDLFTSEEGETIRVVQIFHYRTPDELSTTTFDTQHVVADNFRCGGCSSTFANKDALMQHISDSGHQLAFRPEDAEPAPLEVFLSYANMALSGALQERLARWGREFVDPSSEQPATDKFGNDLGVNMFRAYACSFGFAKGADGTARLMLTCDLRAKVIRTKSVLEAIYEGAGGKRKPGSYQLSDQDKHWIERQWIGEVVIYKSEKKCYTITGIDFNNSPATLPVPDKAMSHAEYFMDRKQVRLDYPDVPPMITVIGRRKQPIYLPAELVMGNELEPRVREMLPQIASFSPKTRNDAIQKIKDFLIPGAQRTKGAGGLLPSVGIVLEEDTLEVPAEVLRLPALLAAGVEVPEQKGENWAPVLNRASFNVNPNDAVEMNVILFYNASVKNGALDVYDRIQRFVNNFNANYRICQQPHEQIETGDNEEHWNAVERYFSSQGVPNNVFVVDFVRPRNSSQDSAYPVVKRMLAENGYLSQFVNFRTYDHANPRDKRKSDITLQGVARQILHKAGFRLWWVKIPKEIPLPAVFVGVDVFHAPMVYDPQLKERKRKASCAAVIVQVFRETTVAGNTKIELFTKTFRREGGAEYGLHDPLRDTVAEAMSRLQVNPASLIMWRDGIGDTAFEDKAADEIRGIREGLAGVSLDGGGGDRNRGDGGSRTPIAYIVCQKRISTKFFVPYMNDLHGAPPGTLVQGIQGLQHETFYINGRAPPYSTPKPVRYIVVEKDEQLRDVPITEATWGQCHDYPNWTGPVKVPSVCQMAHKLAELAGQMSDVGESINCEEYTNTVHFL